MDKLAGKMSDVVLHRAKALFDSTGKKRPAEGSGQQQAAKKVGSARFVFICVADFSQANLGPKCYKCGNFGRLANKCYTKTW